MSPPLLFSLIVAGTVIGLAGTDLVLPAIPSLPDSLPGTLVQAQFVLATFTGGTAIGLLAYGELGARYNQKRLLVTALIGYGIFSFVATISQSINELAFYRLLQGFFAAAPAVLAPGMVRVIFEERAALRAVGLMGSIESIVPALAPLLGAWLLTFFDWKISFYVTANIAFLVALLWVPAPYPKPPQTKERPGGYMHLIFSPVFQRYSLSQAFTLGGLLIFVFGAPTVMTVAMGGTLADFITMQIIGISLFIVATNLAHKIVDAIGNEPTIWLGSGLCAFGTTALLIYGLNYDPIPEMVWFLFAFVNLGLGLRGPPGFYRAIIASDDDDARGAALVMLSVFFTVALGTAGLAPFITIGLVPLAGLASAVSIASLIVLGLLPKLPE